MTTQLDEAGIFLHGKDRTYSFDEYQEITDRALAADDRGDENEYHRLILSMPLHPIVAKGIKIRHGKEYLLEIGADLTEANLVYGEGWLDEED